MRAAPTTMEHPVADASTIMSPARARSARRLSGRGRGAGRVSSGRAPRAAMCLPLLENDDPLARPGDRVRQLRVGIAVRLDLLELHLVQEALVAHQRLHRTQRTVENARDP